LAMNPQYKFNLAIVGPLLVGISDEVVQEMEQFVIDFMPDVPSWGAETPNPYNDPLEDNAD
jgi:hypothetical protein